MRIWIFKGQIAVFLVLLMALIFLFVVITMNIGQFSQEKTVVSQAADGAVLLHASLRSSYGRACWNQIRTVCTDASPVQEHKPQDKWDHCNVDWKAVFILPVGWVLSFLTQQWWIMALAYASLALKALAIDTISLRAQNRILLNFLKSLPSNLQMVENAIGYALSLVVDDPNQVEDIHDINQNGDRTDKVSAFANWRAENLAALVGGNEKPKLDLRDTIKGVLPAFENFRRYLAGVALEYRASAIRNPNDWWKEDYPEFALNPDWKTKYDLEACTAKCPDTDTDCVKNCQKQIDGLTPEVKRLLLIPVNPYYPQDYYPTTPPDYGFMRLLADFEAVKLPRETFESNQEKLPFKIKNVNVHQEDFPEYPEGEEIKYNFLFWKVDNVEPMCSLRNNPDCQLGRSTDLLDSYPVAYYWNGPPFEPHLCPDNVDFVIELLEQFHFFTYGRHEEMWDWSEMKLGCSPDNEQDKANVNCYYQYLRWQPGVASYTDFDAQRSFSTWVRALINLDDYAPPKPPPSGDEQPTSTPEEIEAARVARYRDTLMAQVELLLEMIGPPYGQWVDGYGWWADLQNVKDKAPFFAADSDVAGNPAYKGLNGKRQELRDKMDAVCNELTTNLVPDFNSNLSAAVPLVCCTCQGSVDATQGLSISCNGHDTTVADIDDMITAINTRKTEIEAAKAALARANTKCQGCCTDRKTTCLNDCNSCNRFCQNCQAKMPSDCAPTPPPKCCKDYSCCNSICEQCGQRCNCEGPYNSCIGSCNSTFVPPQESRTIELGKLDVILSYAQKLKLLVESLQTVEELISRVNEAQARIKSFWNVANDFYRSIMEQRYLEQLWDVGNGKAPDQPEVQVIYSWKTKNALAKNVLDPDHPPIRHHVRVTASNPPMPVLKAKRCYGIFGKGAEILNPENDVWVKVERFDEDKALSLGGKGANWLNWLYHTSHPPKDQPDQRSLADIKAENLDEYNSIVDKDHLNWDPDRLFKYAVSSYAKAHYTPRIYRIVNKYGTKVSPVIETHITQTK